MGKDNAIRPLNTFLDRERELLAYNNQVLERARKAEGEYLRAWNERDAQWRRAEAAETELAKAREALADVCNPLDKLRRDAKAQGAVLSSMAHQIANSLPFVQEIARAALAPEELAP